MSFQHLHAQLLKLSGPDPHGFRHPLQAVAAIKEGCQPSTIAPLEFGRRAKSTLLNLIKEILNNLNSQFKVTLVLFPI